MGSFYHLLLFLLSVVKAGSDISANNSLSVPGGIIDDKCFLTGVYMQDRRRYLALV